MYVYSTLMQTMRLFCFVSTKLYSSPHYDPLFKGRTLAKFSFSSLKLSPIQSIPPTISMYIKLQHIL